MDDDPFLVGCVSSQVLLSTGKSMALVLLFRTQSFVSFSLVLDHGCLGGVLKLVMPFVAL